MRTQKSIYEMSDRELKVYRRNLKLRRERRHKLFLSAITLVATICVILVCALSHSSFKANANSDFKYYTGITVSAEETLWDIAEEYIDYEHYEDKSSYIAEVRNINHLDDNCGVFAGQLLIIPYYADEFK